jgi:UDP-glucose 4-epimerase
MDRATAQYSGFPIDKFNGKTILITGAGGYIAGRLLDFLSVSNCKIIAVTQKQIKKSSNTLKIPGDILKKDFWCGVLKDVDVVIHLAGNTSLRSAELDPAGSLQSTVFPILGLIEASRITGRIPKVIFSSTATVYGLTTTMPQSEIGPLNPITMYDLHKYFAEQQLFLASSRGDIEAICLRLSNVYGPSENISSAQDRGILTKVALNALNGDPIKLYGGGEFLRDYIFIDDVVRAMMMIAASNKILPNAMNLSSGTSKRVCDVFRLITDKAQEITGKSMTMEQADFPPGFSPIELRNYVANIDVIKSELGWIPQVTIEAGIDQLIKKLQIF